MKHFTSINDFENFIINKIQQKDSHKVHLARLTSDRDMQEMLKQHPCIFKKNNRKYVEEFFVTLSDAQKISFMICYDGHLLPTSETSTPEEVKEYNYKMTTFALFGKEFASLVSTRENIPSTEEMIMEIIKNEGGIKLADDDEEIVAKDVNYLVSRVAEKLYEGFPATIAAEQNFYKNVWYGQNIKDNTERLRLVYGLK